MNEVKVRSLELIGQCAERLQAAMSEVEDSMVRLRLESSRARRSIAMATECSEALLSALARYLDEKAKENSASDAGGIGQAGDGGTEGNEPF